MAYKIKHFSVQKTIQIFEKHLHIINLFYFYYPAKIQTSSVSYVFSMPNMRIHSSDNRVN